MPVGSAGGWPGRDSSTPDQSLGRETSAHALSAKIVAIQKIHRRETAPVVWVFGFQFVWL
jgi:hypothetical protein